MKLLTWILRLRMSREAAESIVGDLLEAGDGRVVRVLWRAPAVLVTCLLSPRGGAYDLFGRLGRALHPSALVADAGYALRGVRSRPVMTALAVVTLALGIGANVAIFVLFQAVVVRPLPLSDAERLFTSGVIFSYPDYRDLEAASTPLVESLGAWSTTSRPVKVKAGDTVALTLLENATGNYFELLGVEARLGRVFGPDDDVAGAPVAVLSERLWRRVFEADPAVIGRRVEVNGVPLAVVGVAGGDFRGTRLDREVGLWAPLSLHGELATGSRRRLRQEDRGTQWLRIAGRLREGATLRSAEALLLSSARSLRQAHDSPYLETFESVEPLAAAAVSRREEAESFLLLVGAMVVGALLVACTNAAGLLLARLAERRREIGLRLALGAPRWRLVRQFLLESTLVSLMAGALALALGRATLQLIGALQIPGRIAVGQLGAGLDMTVVSFSFGVAVVAGLAFGIVPAVGATRADPFGLLTRLGHGSGSARPRVAQALVAVQVALTMAMVFGGGLFARSLSTALDVDLGFEPSDVIVADIEFGLAGSAEEADTFHRETLAAIEASAAVDSAAWGVFVPVGGGMRMEDFRLLGSEDVDSVSLNYVSPGYFRTLRLPLLRGRPFDTQDRADTAPVAVINASAARAWWPGSEAVGRRMVFPGPEGVIELEVVGVVADSKIRRLEEDVAPYLYLPLPQWTWLVGADPVRLAVRSSAPPARAVADLRRSLREVAPHVPVVDVRTLDAQMFDLLMTQRVGATLLGSYAVLALAIAGLGIYGVVSNAVVTRHREIGVRRALGARHARLLRLMAGYGLAPVAIGVAIGTLLALLTGRLLERFLPGLAAGDPLTLANTIGLLLAVAVIASAVPARRALEIDAAIALKEE